MAIYEVVMVNNLGASSQFIEADTKPTIKEMNYYFDRFMVDNRLNRVSDVIEVTKSQFDKWNKRGDYKLHKYTSKKSSVSQQTNTKNIIQAKCIQKFRDKQGKIYGYRLQDINGQTQDVTTENLKKAINSGNIIVVNLTLTSDNRLVDSNSKQLQSDILGKPPVIKKSYTELEYEWLSKLSKQLFKQLKCGEPEYCGDCDKLNEFMSGPLCTIDSKSLAFSLLGCCQDEYYIDWNGDIEDFTSRWGLAYIIYGNFKTKKVDLYLGSRTFEMKQFKVTMAVNNKEDMDLLVRKAVEIYKNYINDDKKYRNTITQDKLNEFRNEKHKRDNRKSLVGCDFSSIFGNL